ncbi:MAG TPA: hypothetical protein VND45_16380, partial [Thermoanaerobaculia bacterium]|nr:hypothetical protein [Thermoanaerobaculia bacterium]
MNPALVSFVLERFPFAAPLAARAEDLDAFRRELEAMWGGLQPAADTLPDPTPRVSASERARPAVEEVVEACQGFLRREEIAASLTADEKREMLRGMMLTRATDNRLKQFFTGGEVRWGNTSFQGKGFRSLGQEAIYAATIRLRREPFGDVVSPMIRDLGAVLGMHNSPDTVR